MTIILISYYGFCPPQQGFGPFVHVVKESLQRWTPVLIPTRLFRKRFWCLKWQPEVDNDPQTIYIWVCYTHTKHNILYMNSVTFLDKAKDTRAPLSFSLHWKDVFNLVILPHIPSVLFHCHIYIYTIFHYGSYSYGLDWVFFKYSVLKCVMFLLKHLISPV